MEGKTIVTRDILDSKDGSKVLLAAGTEVRVISHGQYFAKVETDDLIVTGVPLRRLRRDRVVTFQYSATLPAEVSDKEASVWAFAMLASAGLADHRPVIAPRAYEAGVIQGRIEEKAKFDHRVKGVLNGISKSFRSSPAGG